MKRSDLFLYLGIFILFLGLVSWYVSRDRLAKGAAPASVSVTDEIPEMPQEPDAAAASAEDGERTGGLVSLVTDQFETLRREGDSLADRIWKDGLSNSQREWLNSAGDTFARFRDFTLSLQFLLILLFTGLLLGLYHLVSSGKLVRLIRKSN
jgi:hypothetical protein